MVRHAMDTTYVYVDHRTTYVSDLRLLSVGNSCDNFVPKVVTWRSVRPLALCTRTFSLVLFPTSKYARFSGAESASETNGSRFSKTYENDRGTRYLTVPPIGRHRFPPLARHWPFCRPTSNDSAFPRVSLVREGIENSDNRRYENGRRQRMAFDRC